MQTRGEPPRSAMTARASKAAFAHGYVYFPAGHGNSMLKTHRTLGRKEDAARPNIGRGCPNLPEFRAVGPGTGASVLSRFGAASRRLSYLGIRRTVHRWRSPRIEPRRLGALKDANFGSRASLRGQCFVSCMSVFVFMAVAKLVARQLRQSDAIWIRPLY